jgi:hypothetical protein
MKTSFIILGVLSMVRLSAQEPAPSDTPQPANESELEAEIRASSDEHMRLELGVNDITTPSIASVLRDLGAFRPVPIALIQSNNREASYANRMQTALHFGSLVADGFMLTIAERADDIQDIGRALIRQSGALNAGDTLTKRSKSLFELSANGDWPGMREELIRTQADVEQSMLELHDEEMAHMISLGGWLRGFQLAARATTENHTAERASILSRTEIIDYYLDRLNTLHPRLKQTVFARTLTAKIEELRALAEASNGSPTREQVAEMSTTADGAVAIALGPVDAEGNTIPPDNKR